MCAFRSFPPEPLSANLRQHSNSLHTLLSAYYGPKSTLNSSPLSSRVLPLFPSSQQNSPEINLLHSLLKTSHPHQHKCGDGALHFLLLATGLLSQPRSARKGIALAASETIVMMSERTIAIPVDSVPALLKLIEDMLLPKAKFLNLSPPTLLPFPLRKLLPRQPDPLRQLAIVLLGAYLCSVGANGKSNVTFSTRHAGVKEPTLLKGTLLLDLPPPPLSSLGRGEQRNEERKAVVFACSLTQKGLGGDETRSEGDKMWHFKVDGEREVERLLVLAAKLASIGAQVVFCQRLIHPALAADLAAKGIVVYHRLGIARVANVGLICGCRVISDWEELLADGEDATVMGTCRLGRYFATGGGAEVATVECAAEGEEEVDKPCTVLMAGDTDNIAENRKSVCELVLEGVECIVADGGRVVSGGGRWQREAGEALLKRAGTVAGDKREGVEVFGNALLELSELSGGGESGGEGSWEGFRSRALGVQAANEIAQICMNVGGAVVFE